MKTHIAIIAVLFAATLTMAQATGSDATAPQAQSGAAPAAPAQHQPQAKSKEEFEAYNAAAAKTDPAQLEAATDEFVQKFPNSELKELLYVRLMRMYREQNNTAKVITTGRKVIEFDPTNPEALVTVASALVMDTRDNDLDRDARYAEAAKDAQAALDNVDTGMQVPAGVSPEQLAAAKTNIRSIAYDTLGVIAMNKKDYPTAEQNFQKAAELMKDQPDAIVYLRLSVVQDNEGKYPQALDSANKAVQYAADGSAERNLAKQQQARLQKLITEKSPATAPPQPQQPH